MAAKPHIGRKEREYLAHESATDLWADIRSATHFTRKLVKKRGMPSRYPKRLLYLMAAAVYRSAPRLIRKKSWATLLDTIEAYADGHATLSQLEAAYDNRGFFSPNHPAATSALGDSTDLLLDDYKVLEGVDFLTDAMGYLGAIKAGDLAKDSRDGQSVWEEQHLPI